MLLLHKLVDSPEAGQYLPFALARLRALERIYGSTGFFQEKFAVDGFRIEVQQSPPFQYIRITGGLYFEFSTSGWPIVQEPFTQEEATFNTYRGAVIGVNVSSTGIRARVLGQKRTNNGADVSKIGRPFQAQLINEPVSYPQDHTRKHYPTALYESWAPGTPHSGVPIRSTELLANLSGWFHSGPTTQYVERDTEYDVPFSKGVRAGKIKTAFLRGDADWPRASGLRIVTDETFGTREFAIYIDAFNQFSVFPTSAIGTPSGVTQNVPDAMVQHATPVFPSWCFVPSTKFKDQSATSDEKLVDSPELDWKLDHEGKHAASIVYERSDFLNDTAYWAIEPHDDHPFTQGMFDQLLPKMGVLDREDVFDFASGYNTPHHFIAPGIIEVEIVISLTGANPEQFSLSLNVTEVRKPSEMEHWPLLCGYVWYDIKDIASAGDFVCLDYERWSVKTGSLGTWSFFPGGNTAEIFSVRNLRTSNEVQSFMARPILGADLSTLSFVFQAYSTELSADQNYLGAAVHVKGEFKEVLLPKTTGRAIDKTSMEFWARKSGRQQVNDLVNSDDRWQYIPPNPTAGDRWVDPRLTAFREIFARDAKFFRFVDEPTAPFYGTPPYDDFKSTPAPIATVASNSAEEDIYGRWQQYPGLGTGAAHCCFCLEPRWGWNTYNSWAASYMWITPETVFYVHPLGTWAFWSNAQVYIPATIMTSFAVFDTDQIEHVIFDKIHFETPTVRKDSSFFALYNKAVGAGQTAGTLEAGIDTLAEENLRATFGKLPIIEGFDLYPDLAATWDGRTWYKPDPGVRNGPGTDYTGRFGAYIGLRFDQSWYRGVYYSGAREYPVSSVPHVRFANPNLVNA